MSEPWYMKNSIIYLWVLLLILIPAIIFPIAQTQNTIVNVSAYLGISLGIVIIMFFLSILIFNKCGESCSAKGNFILSVNIAIIIYHLTVILGILFEGFFGIKENTFMFVQPIIVFIGSIFAIKYYKLKLNLSLKFIEIKKIILSLIIGLLFGLLFYIIKEPIVILFTNNILTFAVFTLMIGISEEILFRFVIFRLSEKAFQYKIALWLQAIIFSLMHFINIFGLYYYYLNTPTIIAETAIVSLIFYFISLIAFGLICAKLMGKRISDTEWTKGNIIYPIIVHWMTNFFTLVLFYSGFNLF